MEDIVIYHNILGIIVSFIYVFSVIFLARFLERFGKEASRKAVHILVCNWWLVTSFLVTLVLLATTGQPQVLMPALTLALLATGLEAITPLGLDNLTVPLVSAGAYYFIFVR